MTSAGSPAVPNTGTVWQQSRVSACQDPHQRVPGHGPEDTLTHNHQEAPLPLVEYVNDAIAVVQRDKTVYRNPAYLRLLGQTAEDSVLRDFLDTVVLADRARVQEYVQKCQRGEAVPEQCQVGLCTDDGQPVTVEMQPRLIVYQGQPATCIVMRDITAHSQAEEALREAHQRTEQVLAAIPSILIGIDMTTKITWWNTTAEQTFGLTSSQVVGRPLQECGIPWDTPAILDGLATCRSTRARIRVDDVRFHPPGKKEGFLGMSLTLMQNASGEDEGILLLGANITERKLMQSQLAQAQKLESIGLLAAGIAHEINTPIQYVGDNMLFLQESFNDLSTLLEHYAALYQMCTEGTPTASILSQVETTASAIDVAYLTEEIPTAIEQSLEGVERVATIVRAMKEFSHPSAKEKVSVDLNKAIESTITVARNEWKYVAQMVTDLDPDLPLVPCVPGELNQVILNILVNAAHALGDVGGDGAPEKGTIIVGTRQVGDGVEICITDTGPGIPAAIRDKIFDPFFTTKEVGKGTGQGLAIAHTVVVEQHGGQLTFETAEGEGTTFIIRLPLTLSGS
jgi:PAS domain S-box-containing protein